MKSTNFMDNVVIIYLLSKSYFIAKNAVVVKVNS